MDEVLEPVVPTISSRVRDCYRQLTLKFKEDYSLVFRAYINGVAYRFESNLPGRMQVKDEVIDLEISGDFVSYFPREESLISHYERTYEVKQVSGIGEETICSLPVLFKSPRGSSVLFTEADLFDYPCMFLNKGRQETFGSLFPGKVLEAAVADYLILARRKGETWFVGAICDTSGPMEFEIDLSFLGEGAYEAVMMEDGINASKIATDYTRKTAQIQAGEKLNIRLAEGGGWAAKFSPSR